MLVALGGGGRAKMDDESILKFVSGYLKKKGFKQTENAFLEELQQSKANSGNNNANNSSSSPISSNSQLDADIAKRILSLAEYSLALHLLLSITFYYYYYLFSAF